MFLYTDRHRNLQVLVYRQTQVSSFLVYSHGYLHVLYTETQKSSCSCIQTSSFSCVETQKSSRPCIQTDTEIFTFFYTDTGIFMFLCTHRYRNLYVLVYRQTQKSSRSFIQTDTEIFTFFYTDRHRNLHVLLYRQTQKTSRTCMQTDTEEHNAVQCLLKNTGLKLFRTGLLCDSLWGFIHVSCKCLWKPQSATTRLCSNQCHISGQSALPCRLTL